MPSVAPSDPACTVVARPIAFDAIPRATWDGLLARTARITPFSRWTWHRAWWDAYGSQASQLYLACEDEAGTVRGIVPLMDKEGSPYFAATYHGDYATVLCAADDLPAVSKAAAVALAGRTVDLRRLRHDDPALQALELALGIPREQEDVCPVVDIPSETDWEGYLGTLDKKDRHEIRRKIRRAESAGSTRFELVEPTTEAVETFIRLHDLRWGEAGLFPSTPAGDRTRTFIRTLARLEADEGATRQLQLGQYQVGDRLIFTTVGFHDQDTCFFYNAGMDPAAKELSPGVTGAAAYLRYELEHGCRRFDFLRGGESYKYEWGAVDQPIYRLAGTVAARP